MGKEKSSKLYLIKQWIDGNPTLSTDGRIVLCKVCDKHVSCAKKFQISQHLQTAAHKKNATEKTTSKFQSTLTSAFSARKNGNDVFSTDLCKALVSANIPLKKVNNLEFRGFLEKYCGRKVPDESTLRKNYIGPVYEEVLQEIKDDIGDSNIWLSVDETTDSCGRFIANVIVGKLSENKPGRPHLIISRELEKTNHSTIARVVRDALRVLWPVQENEERLLLIVTDAAAYMIKAAKALQVFYPKAVHMTCLAHGLHRLAEEIRANFPEVNAVISSVKKVFVKAPSRVKLFFEILPDTTLPPQPILTRWGTWIEAALYYSDHLNDVRKVLEALDRNEAASIETAINACNEKNLQAKLVFIKTYFSKLPAAITRLEEKGMSLTSALQVYETAVTEEVPGEIGKRLRHKIETIEARNPGITFLRGVNSVFLGESEKQFSSYSASDIASLRYCPVTSCDVERSFSSYKNILSDRRKRLLPENIEKYLVVYCNKTNNMDKQSNDSK